MHQKFLEIAIMVFIGKTIVTFILLSFFFGKLKGIIMHNWKLSIKYAVLENISCLNINDTINFRL